MPRGPGTVLAILTIVSLTGCGTGSTSPQPSAVAEPSPTCPAASTAPTTTSPTPAATSTPTTATSTPATSTPATPTNTRASVPARPTVSTYYPPGPLAPVVGRISTSRPIVFITIDDGWTRDKAFPSDLATAGVPTSLFLLADAAKKDYGYFRQLQHLGATIEDHTIGHPVCSRLPYAAQRDQICTTADTYRRVFGRRPTLFRPPYGDFNSATRRAAAACGMHALVKWDVSVNSGRLSFASGHQLRPGDIILMHFTPNLRRDFAAALAAARRQGLAVRRLEDYL